VQPTLFVLRVMVLLQEVISAINSLCQRHVLRQRTRSLVHRTLHAVRSMRGGMRVEAACTGIAALHLIFLLNVNTCGYRHRHDIHKISQA
jgi:hypothetical protein